MIQIHTPHQPSPIALAISDCVVLVRRNLRRVTRNVEELFQAVALPVLLLLIFRYLFGGAVNTGGPSYVNYVVAGVIVLSVTFNATTTSIAVATDLHGGLVERLRSMPVFGPAVLIGHVVSGVLRNLLSLALVIGLGFIVGFRPSANLWEWLAAIGIVVIFMTAIAWLASLFGVLANSVEAASGYSMILVFTPYASSALVPSETMPAVLRTIVEYQPFTPLVNTVRGLLLGTPIGNSALVALLWWLPILGIAMALTLRSFRRRVHR